MLKRILKGIGLVLLCLKTAVVIAQQQILHLSSEATYYDIGKHTAYFEDKSANLTFEQVLASDVDKKFISSYKNTLNFGVTTSAIWVKFTAQNNSYPQYSRWLLMMDYALFDYVHLYQQDKNGNWFDQETGDMFPFSKRLIPHTNFVFALNMPDTAMRTYYVRFTTSGSMQIGLHLKTETFFLADSMFGGIGHGLFYGGLLIMLFYNLILFFSLKDRSYLAYVFFILNNILLQATFNGHITQYILGDNPYWANLIVPLLMSTTPIVMAVFTILFLDTKQFTPFIHKILVAIIVLSSLNFILSFFVPINIATPIAGSLVMVVSIVVFLAAVMGLRKGNKAARFFLMAWGVLILAALSNSLRNFGLIPPTTLARLDVKIASLLEVVLLSMALADKYNLFRRDKEAAQLEILKLQENANKELELKVTKRTAELNQSLENLKATQKQLIQSEKLASLGELTAGIAHEIQNPLNFVNNFSELSVDIAKDLNEELKRPEVDKAYVEELLTDLTSNQEKINHHGKRASSIVKGMLEHSRASTGVKELTDINKLADEYLRLSYHGLRAKDKDFNADFNTEFDENLPKIEVIPQDIGRVLLNLINNAFYAVNERKQAPQPPSVGVPMGRRENYVPTVIVSTHYEAPPLGVGGLIVIKVKDNGIGMPESVRAKVFQPFFTTKPTGQGTGLGLSLAYDIVTKGHGGTLEAESTEGVGTEFIIHLGH